MWDLVIVTARTAQQRWLFERYLRRLWPAPGEGGAPGTLVLQDPPGPQLGTAAATIHAMAAAAVPLGARFPEARVLILHCGGLSQRVPQFSHLGKAFAPAAGPDSDAPLFAQIVSGLGHLFGGMEPGMVIACGDVLFRATQLGVSCRREEAVAVACDASAEQGSRHGVYLWTPGQSRVAEAWQKPCRERLEALDSRRPWGLDTGILFLGMAVVEQLLTALGEMAATRTAAFLRRKREWRGVELYRDLTPPMTPVWSEADCLPGAPGAVQRALSRFPLLLARPQPADLLHFGSNAELIRILADGPAARVYSSYVAAGELGPGAVVDRCLAPEPICVGARSYVAGLSQPQHGLTIAAGRVAYQVPVRAARGAPAPHAEVFVALGVEDDPKAARDAGATLLGTPLHEWLRDLNVTPAMIWEGVPECERCLWNARLFPAGAGESVAAAVPWLASTTDRSFGARVDRWRAHPRTSMAEANRQFDARRWWAHEERIRAHRYAARVEAAVREGDGTRIGALLSAPEASGPAARLARQRLREVGLSESATLKGARAWVVAASLTSPASSRLREQGFLALRRALTGGRAPWEGALEWQIAPGEAIEARAPVRVDLAGGWTDTPPQVCERGGVVLNLALRLDGGRPLTARVERSAEPVLELVAADLGRRRILCSAPPSRQSDPGEPFGIHLGALALIGLFDGMPLRDRLRRLGGGLRLTTAAQVPKGSGLGTSSILGAAVLAALDRALGLGQSRDDLCCMVLRLEQMMGTGGGWQDQVGGMWGGVKFAHSPPGTERCPQVVPLALSPAVRYGLEERMLLFYTGEPRLAKDVLQRVIVRYLTGDAAAITALAEMPALVAQARAALAGEDWDELGRCLNRSWALNQQLEPTSSNPLLTDLFVRIAPFVSGAKLTGAGGGGFLFALARDRDCRARLEVLLAGSPPPAKLYTASLDPEGLTVGLAARAIAP